MSRRFRGTARRTSLRCAPKSCAAFWWTRARKRSTGKHGGDLGPIELSEVPDFSVRKDRDLLALNDAMNHLEESDPRKAKIVELRYFGGLSIEETAALLKVSEGTITRDWRLARGWLLAEIGRA